MKKTNESEIRQEIRQQFTFAKRFLDPVHQRMNEQESLYRSYIDGANYPHNAKVFDPRIFRVIETITPRMVANEPEGSFYPSEEGDIGVSQILNAMIKYDWRRADMFPKLVTFVKSMLIFGTAFGYNHWQLTESEKKRMKPQKVNGQYVWSPTETETVTVTEFDGPNFEPLNIYDCFPDPNATSVNDMRWFIYRTFRTLKELKQENETRGFDYYKNLDKLEEAINVKKEQARTVGADEGSLQWREHRRIMLSTQDLTGQDASEPEIVILRRFKKDSWVDICPEYDVTIRDIENPYFHGELPIVVGVDYPYPGELYGMGEIEPIDRIQRAINAVMNQRLDNVQLTLRTMWKVKKDAGVDMHTLVSAPGNIVTTDNMDAVEPIQVPDVTGATFVQTMGYLTSALQNGSGITDYTIGLDTNTNTRAETATGTRLIQQEASAQFKLKIQLFSHMVIERIANQWKDLRIQFTTEAQKLRILGRNEVKYLLDKTQMATTSMDGTPVVPGDTTTPTKLTIGGDQSFAFLNLLPEDIQPSIVGNYDFIANVSSETLTDPIMLQENFFTALDRVSTPEWTQGLAQEGKALNYTSLTEKVFDKLSIGMDSKDVITDIQQQQQPTDQLPPEMTQVPQELQPQEIPDLQNLMGSQPGIQPELGVTNGL